jgi:hypothetical protein
MFGVSLGVKLSCVMCGFVTILRCQYWRQGVSSKNCNVPKTTDMAYPDSPSHGAKATWETSMLVRWEDKLELG